MNRGGQGIAYGAGYGRQFHHGRQLRASISNSAGATLETLISVSRKITVPE
jgi:hypothetical protein